MLFIRAGFLVRLQAVLPSVGTISMNEPRYYVAMDSWAGRTMHRVSILKKCAKRSKVRFEEAAINRPVGTIQYVPNRSIKEVF